MNNRDTLNIDELPMVSSKNIISELFIDTKFLCDLKQKVIFIRKIKGMKTGIVNLVRLCK